MDNSIKVECDHSQDKHSRRYVCQSETYPLGKRQEHQVEEDKCCTNEKVVQSIDFASNAHFSDKYSNQRKKDYEESIFQCSIRLGILTSSYQKFCSDSVKLYSRVIAVKYLVFSFSADIVYLPCGSKAIIRYFTS